MHRCLELALLGQGHILFIGIQQNEAKLKPQK
jgi:hypothetical protein